MSKRRRHNKVTTITDQGGGRMPRGAWYLAQKGMAYTPSVRDINKQKRKQAKQDLRKGEWA